MILPTDITLQRIIEKITPAVLQMAARKDSGSITIHFSAGQFQRARMDLVL